MLHNTWSNIILLYVEMIMKYIVLGFQVRITMSLPSIIFYCIHSIIYYPKALFIIFKSNLISTYFNVNTTHTHTHMVRSPESILL